MNSIPIIMSIDNLRKQWNEACLSAGIPAISTDKAARILAIVYVAGNNEEMVLNPLKNAYMWKRESKRVVDMHIAIMDDIYSNYDLKRKPNKIDVKICMN